MSLVITVRKVEARHVHACIHQNSNTFFGPASRSHRADDFRATAFGGRLACDHAERNQITMKLGDGTCTGQHGGDVWEVENEVNRTKSTFRNCGRGGIREILGSVQDGMCVIAMFLCQSPTPTAF
jgi:hypothetical protein